MKGVTLTREARIALLTVAALGVHGLLWWSGSAQARWPLVVVVVLGGVPILISLVRLAVAGQFGADWLAGLAIVAATAAGELLVAAVVILMWAGGQALEQHALRRASSVLDALARRNPSHAHRLTDSGLVEVRLEDVAVGDRLVVLPHEICPVDGIVQAGSSTMDESFISGEPYLLRKTVGAAVISGALNGDGALTIMAEKRAADSRYARIIDIVRAAEQRRPPIRRLADRLGAWYTPMAVSVALAAWAASGEHGRALSVLVIATPCPLLLGIPIAIVGALSLAAERSILIRDAAILERIGTCTTAVFDKTGTLTLGRPMLTDVDLAPGATHHEVLQLAASVEQFSKHPLAQPILRAADELALVRLPVEAVAERAGEGLTALVQGRRVRITSRSALAPSQRETFRAETAGLECVLLVDEMPVALFRFRDMPRRESASFVQHLQPRHGFRRILLVSGDREAEVRHLASLMGITEVHFRQTPEQKIAIVTAERRSQPTLFVGDGLNDAAAMIAADAAVAIGQRADVAAESAGAVILDDSIARVDELMHIARRTRRIALQSAVGGMALSGVGMIAAAAGWLPPLAGVLAQEAIDVGAVLNALRAAFAPSELTDFEPRQERRGADDAPRIHTRQPQA